MIDRIQRFAAEVKAMLSKFDLPVTDENAVKVAEFGLSQPEYSTKLNTILEHHAAGKAPADMVKGLAGLVAMHWQLDLLGKLEPISAVDKLHAEAGARAAQAEVIKAAGSIISSVEQQARLDAAIAARAAHSSKGGAEAVGGKVEAGSSWVERMVLDEAKHVHTGKVAALVGAGAVVGGGAVALLQHRKTAEQNQATPAPAATR